MHPSFQESSLIYSVSELNQTVAMALSEGFPALTVVGEVSNFSCPKSGHWYFSLKDDAAQVRCVFFQGRQRCTTDVIKDGMQITVKARLRLYETRGEFQLIIEEVKRIGDGILQQQFEALKQRLDKERLFDPTKKKALPTFLTTVGLITSATGAAIRDVLAVLNRRFPRIAVIIYPSVVQGEAAADQLVKQLELANERVECDVLMITRGGGSLEDLWPFNEEKVARAIANSTLPIVSAIGHEIDTTICDFVSDVRAPTPSAAAELISQDQIVLMHRLDQFEKTLWRLTQQRLQSYQQRLLVLQRCLRHPEQRLQNTWQKLDDSERRLHQAMRQQLVSKQQKLMSLARSLETVNPFATLKRGYALVTHDKTGRILQSSEQVLVKEDLIIQLAKGKLVCKVQKKLSLG